MISSIFKRRLLPVLLTGVFAAAVSGSTLAAVRAAATAPVNNTLPAISGTARQGATLTATNGLWAGTTPMAYSYQWQRCNSTGSSCGAISKATNQNYVASAVDVGRTLRVEVTASNADGKSQALSAATAVIATRGSAPANTKPPATSGTAQEGQTVAVDNGTWSGLAPITFTYQWQDCRPPSKPVCTNIAGATKASYLIGTNHVGSMLRAVVTAHNSIGKTESGSNLTAVVLEKATPPVNVSVPGISGSARVGEPLQASTGVWAGVATNAYSYRWSRCNPGGGGCADISGATGQSYGVSKADLGFALRVTVTATNSVGPTDATSAAVVVKAAQTYRFTALLRQGQETTPPKATPVTAVGHFTASVTGTTVQWKLTFSHLTGRPTAAVLNKGVRGTNGPAFKTICRGCKSGAHGSFTATAAQVDAMMRGRAYVNIQTKRNPHGELRGQMKRGS